VGYLLAQSSEDKDELLLHSSVEYRMFSLLLSNIRYTIYLMVLRFY